MHGDEGAFRKWMSFELNTLHAGLVTQRRPLADLLKEEKPTAVARGGVHEFDRAELARLAAVVPTELRYTLRLPVHVYVDTDVPDALNVQDRPAAEALGLMGYVTSSADRHGKAWFARSIGLQLLRDWPTCVQFVYL